MAKAWLVRSNGRVIGPYREKQVADLLRERVIVPLDEICEPCGSWVYLRDEPLFAKIIEEIRVRNLKGQNDDTSTISRGKDDDQTQTDTDAQPDELTADITTNFGNTPTPHTIQDILFQSIDDAPARSETKVSGEGYVHESDFYVRAQAKNAARWAWVVTVLVIGLTVSFVLFRQLVSRPIQNKQAQSENVDEGILALELGDYEKALDLFDRAHELDSSDTSLYLYLGILKIQVEDQAYQGRRLLEKMKSRMDRDRKRVITGIGLAQLKEGESQAATKSFTQALDVDPLFEPAVINLGAAALFEGNLPKANNHLTLAVKDGTKDGAVYIMLSDTLIRLYQSEKEERYLKEAIRHSETYLKKYRDYRIENMVARLYLSIISEEKINIYNRINEILEQDYTMTEEHRHNLFIYRDLASWSLVGQWCLKATQDLDPTARVISLEALCLAKTGDIVEANNKITNALAMQPKDPLVLSAHAYVSEMAGSSDSAIVSVDKALAEDKKKRWIQPSLLKARYCGRYGDLDCERKYWRTVLQKRPRSLAALAGITKVLLEDKDIKEAKKYLDRGKNLSLNYKPFYELERQLTHVEDRTRSRGL